VCIALVLAALAAWGAPPAAAEDRVRGEVLRVDGNRLWIKADAGQQVEVDVSRVDANKRHLLSQDAARGRSVIVVGEARGGSDRPSFFRARDVISGEQAHATRVRGEVLRVDGNRLWLKADTGQQVEVDISQVDAGKRHLLSQDAARGRSVVVIGEARDGSDRPSFLLARDVVSGDAAGRSTRVKGEVARIEGNRIWLRAQTGQQVEVDVSGIDADRREDLDQGDDIVVLGQATDGDPNRPNKVRASEIRDEGRADGRDRFRGSIVRVDGNRMWVAAETGQQVEVDISKVREGRRQNLAQGDQVLVVGEAKGSSDRPSQFEARRVRRLREASASPRSQ
jgi:ribosome maturation factor RimP